MDDEFNLFPNPDQPIPEILHSEEKKGLFDTCLRCERNLQEYSGFYEIQKIFKHDRPIWEHAICNECGNNLIDEYSDTSRERIRSFFESLDLHKDTLDECHLCQEPVQTGKEHMIASMCQQDSILVSPMILCIDCLDRMNENLSEETRDSWDDFVENNVPGLPAEREPQFDMPVPSIG